MLDVRRQLVFFLILINCFIFAQNTDSDETIIKNQIGIGASDFINSVFSSDENSYSLEYRRFLSNEKNCLRSGISFDEDTSETGFTEFELKIGMDFRLKNYNKWNFYYGIDLLTKYSFYKSSGNQILKVAVAPLFGILFRISKNFSLSKEPSLFIEYNQIVDTDTNQINNKTTYYKAKIGKIGYLQLNFSF